MYNKWTDEANDDIREQVSTAISCKIRIPEFAKLLSKDEIDQATINPGLIIRGDFAFKKSPGCKAGFAAYYNGEKFVNYIGMIKEQFMFAGNQGIELDHNILMCYGMDQKKATKYFKKIAKIISEREPDFRGFVQLNVFVDRDNDWWYDSIVFGAHEELIINFDNLVGSDVINYSEPLYFKNRYSASLRIFPFLWPEVSAEALRSDSELFEGIWETVYNEEDLCFLVYSYDERIKDLWKRLYRKCSGVERFHYLYRIDGYDLCKNRFHEIKSYDLV